MYNSLSEEGGKPTELSLGKKFLVLVASIASIVAIILVIAFVLLKDNNATDTKLIGFTLDSVFNSSLTPKSFNVQWGGNGLFYIYQNTSVSRDLLKFDLATKTSSLFVNATELADIPGYSSYTISPDGLYLLLAVNVSAVWRHSFMASYLIYTVADKTTQPLVDGNPLLQNVVWDPVSHKVAYVRELNIYVFDPSTQLHTQVTFDGDATGGILNGIQSWVYEEEVFSDFNAIWWSMDGTQLAYLRFNESEVPIFEYTVYDSDPYPTQVPLRYPKPGYTNPQVELHIYNVAANNSDFPPMEFGAGDLYEYVASVQWGPGNVLFVQQLNRFQNVSETVAVYNQEGVRVTERVNIQSVSKWINVSPFVFCQDYAITRQPSEDNYHITAFQKITGAWSQTWLTKGAFNVMSISGCSPDGRVYYLSTEPGVEGATLQHIYTTTLAGTPESARTRVSQTEGFFTASFSPLGDYFVMRYAGPHVPQHYMVATDGSYNVTLEANERYAEIIAQYELPEKVFTTVKGAAGDTLNAYYKVPKRVKQGSPLIIDVYAGPNTQDVRQVHDVAGLDAWLCAQGYIVASIDGRGTGGRGLTFLQQTYRQLGLVEMADQRAGAKDLAGKIDEVDKKRVGVWGWSFGGFMAAHGIAGTSPLDGFKFKAAVSVAPVTDWSLYDSIYTERYMSTPADNPEGYNATSVLKRAANVPSNTLLLMHGLADDNVHFQNTAELVSALIQSNVQFDTMFYPNNNHAINSGNARRYLYEKMINFLKTHL